MLDRDPKMFQNLKTNWPNTHAKFEPDWFSGFLKKLLRGNHGFVDLLLGCSALLCFCNEKHNGNLSQTYVNKYVICFFEELCNARKYSNMKQTES